MVVMYRGTRVATERVGVAEMVAAEEELKAELDADVDELLGPPTMRKELLLVEEGEAVLEEEADELRVAVTVLREALLVKEVKAVLEEGADELRVTVT
jgi:hypothetical protein